jgi:hypothetical protein
MRFRPALVVIALLALAPAAHAQDFGVLESAETINQGNLKFGVFPLFLLPDEGDNVFSVAASVGYGLTDSFDIEGRAAFSESVTFLGGDAEYWLVKNRPIDFSIRGGAHFGMIEGDIDDTAGIDLSLIGSAPIATNVELIGAIDMSFNSSDRGLDDDGFTTVHLVPGVEIALTPDLDFLAEFGLGVTDASSNYAGFGLAFYLR